MSDLEMFFRYLALIFVIGSFFFMMFRGISMFGPQDMKYKFKWLK
jgi:hypothetical protein